MSPGRRPRRDAPTDRLHRLWDELADFDASRVDEAVVHAMRVVASVIQAQNAYWIGAVRLPSAGTADPLHGWRVRTVRHLHTSELDRRFVKDTLREVDAGIVDESTVNNMRGAGTFRVNRLRDLVSPAWFETPFYRIGYRARHIHDAMFVFTPVNRDCESCFGFVRLDGHPRFTAGDRDRLAYAVRGLKWFNRRVMLSHGLSVAKTPLTLAEQRVLRLLLTGLSEKQIAHRLDLTPATTHTYVTGILRNYGVSGRAGLTSLWLGHPPPTS
jgi:DNA-binding CsgD family transcriptional regulator